MRFPKKWAHLAPADPAVLPRLRDTWDTSRQRLPTAAASLDITSLGPKVVPLLTEAIRTKRSDLRLVAAILLDAMGPDARSATRDLIACLSDEDAKVRSRAAYALGEIGPSAEAAKALKALATYEADATVRVPWANGSISNTPIGPFQNRVLAVRASSA